ncbi:MAG: tRNA pseudouridine(38-40) synthase TruA [Bdellovibrionales bacterium]|nr:tRNA pseudouridine(38-40) synthase TruA [Bdellovibrionales bacterium]
MSENLPLIRVDVAYDGGPFCGWQKQKHSSNSIQQIMEEAIEKLFRLPAVVHGSGRTDAGVHAKRQVFHFRAPRPITKYQIRRGLGRYLPPEIQILDTYIAPEDFHSRFKAIAKEYRYYIYCSSRVDPFKNRFMTRYSKPINLDLLNAYAATLLGGVKDFQYFANKGTITTTTTRHMYRASWRKQGDIIVFRVIGDGFLKQMVRNFVGNMLYAMESNWTVEQFASLIGKPRTGEYRSSAPAQGLFLYRVYYPSQLDNKCLKLYE